MPNRNSFSGTHANSRLHFSASLSKITELEQLLSKKTGKDIVLVAFSI